MDDLIDFKCSPTWLNFYHEQGLTDRYDRESYEKEERYYLKKLQNLRDVIHEDQVADEAWFEEKLRDQRINRMMQKKDQEIADLRAMIDDLRRQQSTNITKGFQGVEL